MPPLEATSQGCPVIYFRAGSLSEVGGKAAVYFDPADPEDIARVLEETLGDARGIAELIDRGYHREREFNWQRCYNETVAIYRKVAATV